MRNKYGFIEIELGTFTIPADNEIQNLIPEKTKKLLFDIADTIKIDVDGVGINNFTKIPFVHYYDNNQMHNIRAIGSFMTSDDGEKSFSIRFNSSNFQYNLNVSAVSQIIALVMI